jgi:hypothetical protein
MIMAVHKRGDRWHYAFVSAASGIRERSLRHGTRSKLKRRRQRFARRFMTVDIVDRPVRHLSRSLSKRFINLGRERTNVLLKTMRSQAADDLRKQES